MNTKPRVITISCLYCGEIMHITLPSEYELCIELLEACETAQYALRNMVDHHTHDTAVYKLEAAIAKARGK